MIRRAQYSDIESIYKIGEQNISNFRNLYNLDVVFYNDITNIFVIEEQQIIGFIYLNDMSDYVDIIYVAVDINYKNKGFGSKLMEYIDKRYTRNNIFLEVSCENIPALNLYKKFDYELINTRRKYYANNIDAYVMRRNKMNDVLILAIETSCDETSMAIIKNGNTVEALTISTQMYKHAEYGGVVPEIASRMHTESITRVLEDMLSKTRLTIEDVDAIAVTYKPGLLGSLLVGIEFAKTLSYVYNKPLIKVNHLVGHIYANSLDGKLTFPLLALVVSGGHTELVLMEDHYQFKILGKTLDDAIGECYDKVARVIGIPYPGGPGVEKAASLGIDEYKFKVPKADDSYDFSYSGLKSNVINAVHNKDQKNEEININNIACSFQKTAIKQLTNKLELALKNTDIKNIIIAGGVSANQYLRDEVKKSCDKYNAKLSIPKTIYCTDNAAMIGAAAYPLYLEGKFCGFDLNGKSDANIAE